jgi:hypothetical protein
VKISGAETWQYGPTDCDTVTELFVAINGVPTIYAEGDQSMYFIEATAGLGLNSYWEDVQINITFPGSSNINTDYEQYGWQITYNEQ